MPLLALGVPGSPTTAIMMGALIMHGLHPGPQLFAEAPSLVYAILFGVIIASLVQYLVGSLFLMLLMGFTINLLTLLVGQLVPERLFPPVLGVVSAEAPRDLTQATAAVQPAADLPTFAEVPAGLPSDLLLRRPDIRAAEQQLIGANANIGAARANYFPRISLTASAGSASTELSGLFKSGSFGWTFAPQAVLPIFDLGRVSAGVDVARVNRDIAVAQYEQSIQTAFREVADALAGQATFSEQLRAQRAVAAAEETRFKLSDLRYRSGAASYLDLLDAQRSLFQAQQQAVEANLARLQNQVTLYRVLGGGWSEPAAETQAAR